MVGLRFFFGFKIIHFYYQQIKEGIKSKNLKKKTDILRDRDM